MRVFPLRVLAFPDGFLDSRLVLLESVERNRACQWTMVWGFQLFPNAIFEKLEATKSADWRMLFISLFVWLSCKLIPTSGR